MPNGKGFRNHNDEKTQPGKPGGYSAKYNGHGHDFNSKGKITKPGSSYHGYGDAEGNFSQKDSQLSHLTSRGKKGQSISEYTGTNREGHEHTHNAGPTAYNTRPIDQTYTPATSHGVPTSEQIVYHTKEKKVIKDA